MKNSRRGQSPARVSSVFCGFRGTVGFQNSGTLARPWRCSSARLGHSYTVACVVLFFHYPFSRSSINLFTHPFTKSVSSPIYFFVSASCVRLFIRLLFHFLFTLTFILYLCYPVVCLFAHHCFSLIPYPFVVLLSFAHSPKCSQLNFYWAVSFLIQSNRITIHNT